MIGKCIVVNISANPANVLRLLPNPAPRLRRRPCFYPRDPILGIERKSKSDFMQNPTIPQTADTCVTGIPGLDDVLSGGLPAHRIYLIQGDPGVGKTTLGMQFLLEGLRRGEKVLYITLSETLDELRQVADSHGWDLSGLEIFELSSLQDELEGKLESTFFHPSEIELNRTTEALLDRVEKINPSRIVFDSLSEMRMLAETPLRYRRQMLQLKQFFAGRKATVCFLDDRSSGSRDLQIESIAHGVISLMRTSPEYGIARRQIIVQKIRGIRFREGYHDLILKKGGMKIFPRLVAAEHYTSFERGSFTSGVPELDALLGGGLDRGTSTMFMGPPGTGKSTLAVKFAYVAAQRGEKSLFFLFDEAVDTLVVRAAQIGMDLEPFLQNGDIRIEQIDPAEISPGELTCRIRDAVLEDATRLVVIDSINGYMNAMPQEHYLNLQLHELLAFLNQQGVITILMLAQHGVVGILESSVDLTYLADTVLLLRYFESHGSVRQAVSVIKKRSGDHERSIREIWVGRNGIAVGPPLRDVHGILGGHPTFTRPESKSSGPAAS